MRITKPVDGTTPPAQVDGMASSTQSSSIAEFLPDVQLDVRHGSARPVAYAIDGVDFLIGAVPGCDLRVGGETPSVLCLLARHPDGVSLRRLTSTQTILVNGQNVSQRELADGDRVQIGSLDIRVRIMPAMGSPAAHLQEQSAEVDRAKAEFHDSVLKFREQLIQLQHEKDAFEKQRQQQDQAAADKHQQQTEAWQTQTAEFTKELHERDQLLEKQQRELARVQKELANAKNAAGSLDTQHADLKKELLAREDLLEERAIEIDRQKQSLAKLQKELADAKRGDSQRAELSDQVRERDNLLEERTVEIDRQKQSLAKLQKELADAKRGDSQRAELASQVRERDNLLEERAVELDQQKQSLAKLQTEVADARRSDGQRAELMEQVRERDDLLEERDLEIERQRQELTKLQKEIADAQHTAGSYDGQRADLVKELRAREDLLEERTFEIEHQKEELAKVRQEMADTRRQLFDHYQERRDQLAAAHEELAQAKRELDEREKKIQIDEEDTADRRKRDRQRQEDIDRAAAELAEQTTRLEEQRKQLDERERDCSRKAAEFEQREKNVADLTLDFDIKVKQYEADVLRLNRLQGTIEERELDLRARIAQQEKEHEQLQHDSQELHDQLQQFDEWRIKFTDDTERLGVEKQAHETATRQIAERAASLEGQQATLAILRTRLERMRDEIRAREQELDTERERHDAREAQLAEREEDFARRKREVEAEHDQYARDRTQWLERSAVLETAVRQLKEAQQNLATEQDQVRRAADDLELLRRQHADSDGILQSRLAQLAEARERLDFDRQALQQRSINITQREEACATLQEQLHRRSEELASRHKETTDQLQAHQARLAELADRAGQLDQREAELQQQIETWQHDLKTKAAVLQQQAAQIAGLDNQQQEQMNQLAVQRKAHADERAQFQLEQQFALEKLAQAKAELEAMRGEAMAFIQHLPDAESRAGAAVDRLSNAREQLRNHLGEIHQYVRQCQDELEGLRTRLQCDLDKLDEREQTLRRGQDEHRLAMTAYRQQLIDWQGQIVDLKRLLTRDSSRLERQQAQVDERAKEVDAQSERLAQHAEELQAQERDVADRREEMDRHLVDMREWYRRKLRELAGIPLVPDMVRHDEPAVLPGPHVRTPSYQTGDAEDPGIVPTGRNILSITAAVDQGDQKLGQVLRDSQLVDADTLTALLAEARRQRRSLRHVLLASGVITLYQLALIEAGNVQGLMLGPVRIVDRLRNTAHETVYRVFDPRRGVEAVLRHLAEADMTDAVKPDEFRQRFGQAMLNDPHLANTLEVLELAGRPAAEQEWLSGLPASDWPPLAAAPGVCYRLLTQAAQGLATAHQAGMVHGHLSDSLLFLTGDGVLKICGLGEPPWLIGVTHDEEPTPRDDLRTLGKIVSGWCTPSGVRKGSKTKPLPETLVSVLYRLAADGDAGYRDVQALLDDLQKASGAIPANAEAWDRLLKYVREHGTAEALLRQSA